jgi:hypothetical protein
VGSGVVDCGGSRFYAAWRRRCVGGGGGVMEAFPPPQSRETATPVPGWRGAEPVPAIGPPTQAVGLVGLLGK